MQAFEYKVVPAPHKGIKAKGVKTPEARFANSVETTLNEMAAEGWEYLRAELLPSDERSGLTGSTTHWRNVLVFRRAIPAQAAGSAPVTATTPAVTPSTAPPVATPPVTSQAASTPPVQRAPVTATAGDPEAPADAKPVPGAGAAKMQADDGVEELSPVSGMTAALKARAKLNTPSED
ncbi:hypothetical protein PH5382_00328 [Phaeobacter sp. CECT 5382]|uniref:DUF4177 domain-containing protein n=1 Tax=Phaeobacter sp. CECT 5382 TaxID=1712645 RepID=UPI0006D9DA4F|nr:DUF4177 domain-containing protein [Phaeobacter sp. CECT 5382]CUH86419.1 hypothetical protein PH5382_00328 [Phaeobacter sp. CECT 5382]